MTFVSNDFLNRTQKTLAIKTNIDKLNFPKMKNFCLPKDIMKRVKSKPQRGCICNAFI